MERSHSITNTSRSSSSNSTNGNGSSASGLSQRSNNNYNNNHNNNHNSNSSTSNYNDQLDISYNCESPTNEIMPLDNERLEELNRLSPRSREIVDRDVRGRDPVLVEESEEFVNERIQQVNNALASMKDEDKVAFMTACRMNPKLQTSRKLRLQFLRAESFNPGLAAHRITQHFDFKNQWFCGGTKGGGGAAAAAAAGGDDTTESRSYRSDILGRKIKITKDLDEYDQETLAMGGAQILPQTDMGGRRIFFFRKADVKYSTSQNMLNALWYVVQSLAEDEEVQKRGVVGIIYCCKGGSKPAIEAFNRKSMVQLATFMRFAAPVRLVGLHYVYDDSVLGQFSRFILDLLPKTVRLRFITHLVPSHLEAKYSLMEYGIPENAIPVTSDGKLVRDGHLGWLANQRRLEEQADRAEREQAADDDDDGEEDGKPSSSSSPREGGVAEGTNTSASTVSDAANPDAISSSPSRQAHAASRLIQPTESVNDAIPPASVTQPPWNVGGIAEGTATQSQITSALEAILRGALQNAAGPVPGPVPAQAEGMTNQLLASNAASLLSQWQAAQFLQLQQQQAGTTTSMETGSDAGAGPRPMVPTEVGPQMTGASQPSTQMHQATGLQAAQNFPQDRTVGQQHVSTSTQAAPYVQQPTSTYQFIPNFQQAAQPVTVNPPQEANSQTGSSGQSSQNLQLPTMPVQFGTNTQSNQMVQQQATSTHQFGNIFLSPENNQVASQTTSTDGPVVSMPNTQNIPIADPVIAAQILSAVQNVQNMTQQPNNSQPQLAPALQSLLSQAVQATGDGQAGQPMQNAYIQFVPQPGMDFQNVSNPGVNQGNNSVPIQGTVAIPGLVPGTFFVGNVLFDPQALLAFGLSSSAPAAVPSSHATVMSPSMQPSSMFRPIINPAMAQNVPQVPQPLPPPVPPPPPVSLPVTLYLESDANSLSDYQCFLRQQIEAFEASRDDVQYNASRMNRSIVLGQVGLRCVHCKSQPEWDRASGAVYYPGNLSMLYQAGQNMAKNHLCHGCRSIPQETRDLLNMLRGANRRATTGKEYWGKTARALGIYEDGSNGLKFRRLQG